MPSAIFDVYDWGVYDGGNAGTNTSALQYGIDNNSYGACHFRPGTFNFNNTITWKNGNYPVGAGQNSTFLVYASGSTPVFFDFYESAGSHNWRGCDARGFSITSNSTGHCIKGYRLGDYSCLSNILVHDCAGIGIYLQDCFNMAMRSVAANSNASYGGYITGASYNTTLDNCFWGYNVTSNLHFNGGGAITLKGGSIYTNQYAHGLSFQDTRGIIVDNTYFEGVQAASYSKYGIYLNGASYGRLTPFWGDPDAYPTNRTFIYVDSDCSFIDVPFVGVGSSGGVGANDKRLHFTQWTNKCTANMYNGEPYTNASDGGNGKVYTSPRT